MFEFQSVHEIVIKHFCRFLRHSKNLCHHWPKDLVYNKPILTKALRDINIIASSMDSTNICVYTSYHKPYRYSIQLWACRYTVHTYKFAGHVCNGIISPLARWVVRTWGIFSILKLKFCRPLSLVFNSNMNFEFWDLYEQLLSDSAHSVLQLGCNSLICNKNGEIETVSETELHGFTNCNWGEVQNVHDHHITIRHFFPLYLHGNQLVAWHDITSHDLISVQCI